jgi:hypothetical protein
MLSGPGFNTTIAHKFVAHPNRGLTICMQQILALFKAFAYPFEIITDEHSFLPMLILSVLQTATRLTTMKPWRQKLS